MLRIGWLQTDQAIYAGNDANDASALTRADIGIAIESGTDVAVQSADIILVQNNPIDVVRLVKLSRASYKKRRENIVWAAGYNVFAIRWQRTSSPRGGFCCPRPSGRY